MCSFFFLDVITVALYLKSSRLFFIIVAYNDAGFVFTAVNLSFVVALGLL